MDANRSRAVIMYLENFLMAADNMGINAKGDTESFYEGIENYKEGPIKSIQVNVREQEENDNTGYLTTQTMGMFLMFILFFSTKATTLIVKDKKDKTFFRLICTPYSIKRYMFENILSFLIVSIIQIGLIMFIVSTVFNLDLGHSPLSLFMILVIFGMVSISLGVALTRISDDVNKISPIASAIIIPMVMLGGALWPIEIMPEIFQQLSNFMPTTWAMLGIEKLLVYDYFIFEIYQEIGILLLFSLAFFLLGTWKKEDVEN